MCIGLFRYICIGHFGQFRCRLYRSTGNLASLEQEDSTERSELFCFLTERDLVSYRRKRKVRSPNYIKLLHQSDSVLAPRLGVTGVLEIWNLPM